MVHFFNYCAIECSDGTGDTTCGIDGILIGFQRHYLLKRT